MLDMVMLNTVAFFTPKAKKGMHLLIGDPTRDGHSV